MRFSTFTFLLLLYLLPGSAFAEMLACDNGTVSSGDRAVDLLVKCGQPDWKDVRSEEIYDNYGQDIRRKTYITIEEWTYNFGPNRFLRMVTIRNGIVSDIRTGKSGSAKDLGSTEANCGDRIISTGDTKADVLVRCGEPFYKSSHLEELREHTDVRSGRSVAVTVEEWTYNLGPQRFMRIITFRNGIVIDVRTGNYGR